MRRNFRDFKIDRSCSEKYDDYKLYKPYLKKDFKNRCAYCNLLDNSITTPFEVEHFVPRDTFKDIWPECDTLYDNLMYSCKKCNMAKSSQYAGNILDKIVTNDYFYNPVVTDYGKIFYRNDTGGIDSDDAKGKEMIKKLKLYRPIHNMAWICETLKNTLDKLNMQLDKVGRDTEQGKILIRAKEELSDYYNICRDVFIENYNNNKFVLDKAVHI